MKFFILCFVKDEFGVIVIEYGFIVGLLFVVILGVVFVIGISLISVFINVLF